VAADRTNVNRATTPTPCAARFDSTTVTVIDERRGALGSSWGRRDGHCRGFAQTRYEACYREALNRNSSIETVTHDSRKSCATKLHLRLSRGLQRQHRVRAMTSQLALVGQRACRIRPPEIPTRLGCSSAVMTTALLGLSFMSRLGRQDGEKYQANPANWGACWMNGNIEWTMRQYIRPKALFVLNCVALSAITCDFHSAPTPTRDGRVD
jgi:hypothetical protein